MSEYCNARTQFQAVKTMALQIVSDQQQINVMYNSHSYAQRTSISLINLPSDVKNSHG